MYNPNLVKDNPKSVVVVRVTSIEDRDGEIIKVSTILKEKTKNTSIRCTIDKELFDKLEGASKAWDTWNKKDAVTVVVQPKGKTTPKKSAVKEKKGAPQSSPAKPSSDKDGEQGAAAGAAITPPKSKTSVRFDDLEEVPKPTKDSAPKPTPSPLPVASNIEDKSSQSDKEAPDDLSDTSTVEEDPSDEHTKVFISHTHFLQLFVNNFLPQHDDFEVPEQEEEEERQERLNNERNENFRRYSLMFFPNNDIMGTYIT